MITKLLNFINYWLVPPNATPEERLRKIEDVGLSIGLIIGFIFIIIYILFCIYYGIPLYF